MSSSPHIGPGPCFSQEKEGCITPRYCANRKSCKHIERRCYSAAPWGCMNPEECARKGGCEFKEKSKQVCRVCDGGPGNDGPCLCSLKSWENSKEKPAAFLHIRREELTQTSERLSFTRDNPFGKPGQDYSADWPVTIIPLYPKQEPSK